MRGKDPPGRARRSEGPCEAGADERPDPSTPCSWLSPSSVNLCLWVHLCERHLFVGELVEHLLHEGFFGGDPRNLEGTLAERSSLGDGKDSLFVVTLTL